MGFACITLLKNAHLRTSSAHMQSRVKQREWLQGVDGRRVDQHTFQPSVCLFCVSQATGGTEKPCVVRLRAAHQSAQTSETSIPTSCWQQSALNGSTVGPRPNSDIYVSVSFS